MNLKTFNVNGRTFTARQTKTGGVVVEYGHFPLPSSADPEIFIRARQELGMNDSEVIEPF